MRRNTIDRVFDSICSIINLAIKENGLEWHNMFSGTYLRDGLQSGYRKPVPMEIINQIQNQFSQKNEGIFSIIALLRDAGIRIGEAINLLN